MNRIILLPALIISLALFSCSQKETTVVSEQTINIADTLDPELVRMFTRDQVNKSQLTEVRLGDGVPLGLNISVRWKINDLNAFLNQFEDPADFDAMVLKPREYEIASTIANTFPSVDSVFSVHRQQFAKEVKAALLNKLGEEGVTIKEVMLSEVEFPNSFTEAMEKIALNERELEGIRQSGLVDKERALAAKEKAKADGEVAIEQAKIQGELQEIQSETEQKRRMIEIAKAETQAQLTKKNAEAEALRLERMAEAEAKKREDLNTVEVKRQREMDAVALDKQRAQNEIAISTERAREQMKLEQELELAKLCQENPVYASFLVNKELASKVQIAVLPSGTDANIFGDLLKNGLANTKQ